MDVARDGVPPLTSRFVDLHLHSTASDGEVAPSEVVRRAAAADLAAIALTDHDTVTGLPEAVDAGDRLGVRVVTGCEFSVAAPWGELHVLAYFLPLASAAIDTFLQDRRDDRHRRAATMVRRLNALGIDVSLDDVEEIAAGASLGRPHVARALVGRGAVADVGEAFDRYLGWGRPAFEPKRLPTLGTLAHTVHAAGGLLSAAHLKDRATRKNLATLQAAGLDAVEVLHPRHSHDMSRRIDGHAEALGLLRSGGSDWHGDAMAGMRHADIGSQRVPFEWLERLDAARPSPGGGDASG